jgi:hypothetical protein
MSTPAILHQSPAVGAPARHRSLAGVLEPLDRIAAQSASLIANHDARFEVDGRTYELPRYLYLGPDHGSDPIRIGIFAGIHGDEPEGPQALVEFVRLLEAKPELARGYVLFLYPVNNPTGLEDGTRLSRSGRDLNREFWKGSKEPEVQLLEAELTAHALHGIISLHTDDTSHGLYGFASGSTLTEHLIEPALRAAAQVLPRNQNEIIDGFHARNGIIREGYEGVLSAHPEIRPRPFEIILETPRSPAFLKQAALVVALQSILLEYRKFIAYAPNL